MKFRAQYPRDSMVKQSLSLFARTDGAEVSMSTQGDIKTALESLPST